MTIKKENNSLTITSDASENCTNLAVGVPIAIGRHRGSQLWSLALCLHVLVVFCNQHRMKRIKLNKHMQQDNYKVRQEPIFTYNVQCS